MARFTRKTVILAKIETVTGTDALPSGSSDAVLISNQSITPYNANNISRALVRAYFGASGQLVGSGYVDISFDVEIAGSGAAGTAPAWGPLLRACSFAETLTASVRAEYNPITDGMESATIYYYDDGALHKLLGARGSFSMKMNAGERPVFSFHFLGIYAPVTAAANPSQTLTAWQTPLAVIAANSGDITLGCTYTAATPALTGGTAHASRGIEIDVGVNVQHTPLLGGESIDITAREASARFLLDLTAAQEATAMVGILNNATTSAGFEHGTTAGNKLLVYMPALRRFNPRKEEFNGRRLIGFDASVEPVSGNDELKIVAF